VACIVLNTFGSFGDLHPYIALGIELRLRGHRPVIATSEVYRLKVEGEGLDFHPVRPDVGELLGNEKFIQKLWDPKHGTEYLIREYIMPHVTEGFEDLSAACKDADLLLTHAVGYAGPLVAEKQKLPWFSVALQPAVFLSVYDPPVLVPAPWLRHLRLLGPGALKATFAAGKRITVKWAEPIRQLRRQVGLPATTANPMFEGQFSPKGTLALFSSHFAQPQPDWPAGTVCTGFPFYDRESADRGMDSGLVEFLEAGPAPIVFTLGSSAVMAAGNFYEESAQAARQLGLRAVLLMGVQADAAPAKDNSIYVARYAPYSELLPKASATVHQGGVGTTAQALRAGRPMLVVPWSHDQPDNADRIQRLGVGRSLKRSKYNARNAAGELKRLLHDERYAATANKVGAKIAGEDGVSAACNVIEAALCRG
jgi:UDP:flavonoid glycosyltransferase YjiC (YdhE family)